MPHTEAARRALVQVQVQIDERAEASAHDAARHLHLRLRPRGDVELLRGHRAADDAGYETPG